LGLGVDGFPNLFVVTGPGSPAVLANMVLGAEQHIDWVGDCLNFLAAHGCAGIEATPQAVEEWGAELRRLAEGTLFTKANSWYLGANVPGKPRVFMLYLGGFGVYNTICAEVADAGYKGFGLIKG
jgi:cyclohexanone monooxygenase